MKQIFTLFTSLLLTISIFAADARPKSSIMIKSVERNDIRVIIDGRRFEPNTYGISITGLKPGQHSVKIYRERNFGLFTIFGSKYDVVFNSTIFIKPQTNVVMTIDRFGRTSVTETRIQGRGYDRDRNRGWEDNRDFDFDSGRDYGDYNDRDRDRKDRDNRWDDQKPAYPTKAINDREFDMVLDNISKERFESNMMKSATQIINTNYFTSQQVKELLQLFSFESNKLELAKLGYDKTVDQKNFYIVNEVFSFSSSKDELARYTRIR